MLNQSRKNQVSTFTGGLFAAGAVAAGFETFKPLLTLISDHRVTIRLHDGTAHDDLSEAAHVMSTELTTAIDASALPTWIVVAYAVGSVLTALGLLSLIVGYASFIASSGAHVISSNRWPLTITTSGLLGLIGGVSGGWLTNWTIDQAAFNQGLPHLGYNVADQSTFFITVVASAVLTLLGLTVSHTHELEEETSGLV